MPYSTAICLAPSSRNIPDHMHPKVPYQPNPTSCLPTQVHDLPSAESHHVDHPQFRLDGPETALPSPSSHEPRSWADHITLGIPPGALCLPRYEWHGITALIRSVSGVGDLCKAFSHETPLTVVGNSLARSAPPRATCWLPSKVRQEL